MIVLYPGTFDPITNGHTDLIRRATRLCDKVVVAIAESIKKAPCFTLEERTELARQALKGIDKIEIQSFNGLTVDAARDCNARAILRGLRAVSDFEYEFQLASMNRNLAPEIETLFLTPAEQHSFISSSLVKEIARMGGDVSHFIAPEVCEALKRKF